MKSIPPVVITLLQIGILVCVLTKSVEHMFLNESAKIVTTIRKTWVVLSINNML